MNAKRRMKYMGNIFILSHYFSLITRLFTIYKRYVINFFLKVKLFSHIEWM